MEINKPQTSKDNPLEVDSVKMVKAAAEVLSDLLPIDTVAGVQMNMSALAASRLIAQELQLADSSGIENLLNEKSSFKEISDFIVGQINDQPQLASQMAINYKRLTRELDGTGPLVAGALIVLALKLKTIRWGANEKVVSFYELSDSVREFVVALTKRVS